MPISLQTIDPTRIPLQETGKDAFGDILRGYKMSKVPGALERKRIAEEQKNKIGGVRAQYAEPMAKNAMEMSNILLGLRNKYGERSELAKIRGLESNAELRNAMMQSGGRLGTMPNIVKLQNALSQEIEANGPNTETAQQIRDAITKSTSGITSSVRTQAQKRDIFNTAREEIARVGSMPDRYLGAMGDATILKDIGHYNLATDPIKKKEIGDNLVRAAVSDKIAPEYAMVQVGAQGNNLTVEAGKQQEKAIKQGWPKFYKRYLNNLPRELQAKAKEEHDRLIQQLNEATGNSYSNMINPYLSNKTQSGLRKEKNTTDNKGKYTGFMNGKKYSIPENKIKEFMSAGGDISE